MAQANSSRLIGELTFQDISQFLRESSILCMPVGAIEQHGPHLPLNTDVVLAEGYTRLMVARWGERFDLWQLPTLSIGLSREHDWAAGTLSLSIASFVTVLRDLGREIVRSLPARNLVVVNGHGGNRGILEPIAHELRAEFGLNVCILHPAALWGAEADAAIPEVHGGKHETAAMLALAPHLVRRERIAELTNPPDGDTVRAVILEPATTWPWSTGDARIADLGVIGDPRAGTAEYGQALIDNAVEAAGAIFERLLGNQQAMRQTRGAGDRDRT